MSSLHVTVRRHAIRCAQFGATDIHTNVAFLGTRYLYSCGTTLSHQVVLGNFLAGSKNPIRHLRTKLYSRSAHSLSVSITDPEQAHTDLKQTIKGCKNQDETGSLSRPAAIGADFTITSQKHGQTSKEIVVCPNSSSPSIISDISEIEDADNVVPFGLFEETEDLEVGESASDTHFQPYFSIITAPLYSDTEKAFHQRNLNFVASRPKVDLSYQHVRNRELMLATGRRSLSPFKAPTDFRDNRGLRLAVQEYMRNIEPLLKKPNLKYKEKIELDNHLQRVFSPKIIEALHQKAYDVEDIASWSWIFTAQSTEQSIQRYVLLARQRRNKHQSAVPLFVPLQLLRSRHISQNSLRLLIDDIEVALGRGNTWGKESGAIVLIRLLRHARLVDLSSYDRIAELAPRVLPFDVKGDYHNNAQRLTHFYNRFLSLLALPLARHPFLSVDAQQRAQLKIARCMMESEFEIALTREGYRALARVQLMHKKTLEEQRWSAVKAPSWPPWRRDELGIDARIDYPGRQSRVSKVIKRLLEAGYGPESMEHEAQILAGWDTDKSPTVQVRRVANRRPLTWLRSMWRDRNALEKDVDHDVWAARVTATRSVREAWICFYSYMHATVSQKRQVRVYHEMFYKLFARTHHTDQRHTPYPGDGKEVFADPISTRDLAYVPKEPPSIEELYVQMIQDGLRPGGRLLASLVDNAQDLRQGLSYFQDSSLGDVKKDVLLHPEKYPANFIRNIFSTLPNYLLASYIGMLTTRFAPNEVKLYCPGSRSSEERGLLPLSAVKPLHYGMAILQTWNPVYLPAYHAILEGICIQAKARNSQTVEAGSRKHTYAELWSLAKQALSLLETQGLQVDLVCFRKIVLLLRNSMIRAPAKFHDNHRHFGDAVSVAKSLFVKSLGGYLGNGGIVLPNKTLEIWQQPYWKDIEALILICGYGRDFKTVVDVLKWLRLGQDHLQCVGEDDFKMQRLTCAARVALEGIWANGRCSNAGEELLDEAKGYMEQWCWPDEVDVAEYVRYHKSWFEGMRASVNY